MLSLGPLIGRTVMRALPWICCSFAVSSAAACLDRLPILLVVSFAAAVFSVLFPLNALLLNINLCVYFNISYLQCCVPLAVSSTVRTVLWFAVVT